jgi:glutamine amidotransferase
MIVIVDYKMGNLGSIKNMIKKIGHKSVVSSNKDEILKASKIILPGVGSFDRAIQNINQMKLKESLEYVALTKKVPVLGICLGMQLMTSGSEEGNLSGLGWIKGKCKKFDFTNLRIPHMGWNYVKVTSNIDLTKKIDNNYKFYFVHSYYVSLDDKSSIILSTNYGIDFCSAYKYGNIFGVQFHPEKSHRFGMQMLTNFIKI